MNTIWFPDLSDTDGPKYKVLIAALEGAVAAGNLEVGEKLPPVREVAWQLQITPGTVARAYSTLVDQGTLEAVVGRGTFVAAPPMPVMEDVWSRSSASLTDRGMVNLFSPRLPDKGQVAMIRSALTRVSQGPAGAFLNYPTRDAYKPAREAVLGWLNDVDLGSLSESDIVLTHGGQNAISLVMQAVLTGAKPTILVEELTYAGFRRAAEMLRVDVVGVPCDEGGVIPEELERLARRHSAQLFCTSPEVHNPTGGHTGLERRKELVAVCQRVGIDILEDDCYRIGPALASSYRALWPEHAWYISSISKTITPSLRIGFAVAPLGQMSDLRRAAEYGFFGLAWPLAEVARLVLADPKTLLIQQEMQKDVRRYIEVAVNTLGRYDLNWRGDVPFIWLNLPTGWRGSAFTRAAERAGIQIRSADEFALRDGRAPHAVRISINGQIPIEAFEAAMQTLRSILENPPEQISV